MESAKRHKVLLVEDDPLAARVAEKILDRLGYAVCAVLATGEEAVAQAESLAPDVVLMDINLAGAMDGVAAAKAILATLCVPVIFLTAAVGRDIMERVAETGAAGYIQKPVKLLDFKANLEMAIARSQRGQTCCSHGATDARLVVLETITRVWGQPLAVIDPSGHILFAWPDTHLAGSSLTEAFPAAPAAPAPDDTPCRDATGRTLAYLRLLPMA